VQSQHLVARRAGGREYVATTLLSLALQADFGCPDAVLDIAKLLIFRNAQSAAASHSPTRKVQIRSYDYSTG